MTKSKMAPTPISSTPEEPITVFDVAEGGTLRMADYAEAQTRTDFYKDVADRWEGSPKELANAADECQPLAWAVNSTYAEFRDEIVEEIGRAETDESSNVERVAVLKARLATLPEEPEEGYTDWLMGLNRSEFETNVVPRIQEWFSEPPDWRFEDDYLLETGTAQGAALDFFRGMSEGEVDLLGVNIVEGDRPGSSYYAAELRTHIDQANRAAVEAGISVRFKKAAP